ncbi:MAG: hypothetical protein J5501_01035 [Ruminococcus sp.]|nr:hypothetical protein [Ruminococcus sp.]
MKVKCYEINYSNYGRCICLENGNIKMLVTVDVGPRIVFFGFSKGSNILFEDTERNFYEINKGYGVWYAYGGHRIWCAPEKMPETYFPDNTKVNVEYDGSKLTLTPEKTAFGKQFSLVCMMDENNTVYIENRITNCSGKPADFAPWSITGLAGGGTEIIPLCTDDNGFLPNRTMALWSYSDIKDERFTLCDKYAVLKHDPSNNKAFKAGFNVTGGQVVYVQNDMILRKSFDGYKNIVYPDFCCNFETYTNDLFLECEILGEMKKYQPGETAVIKEKWELIRTDGDAESVIKGYISELS